MQTLKEMFDTNPGHFLGCVAAVCLAAVIMFGLAMSLIYDICIAHNYRPSRKCEEPSRKKKFEDKHE